MRSQQWTELPFPQEWVGRRFTLYRGGTEAAMLVVAEPGDAPPGRREPAVAVVRPETGEIVREIVLPDRMWFLASDPGATRFVVSSGHDGATLIWDAASTRSTRIAALATQATW